MSIRLYKYTKTYFRHIRERDSQTISESKQGILSRVTFMITAVCVLTLFVIPFSVFGQAVPELREGDRVRVTAEGVSGIFLLQSFDNNIMMLRDITTDVIIRVQADNIERLHVSQGFRSPNAGFRRGAKYGLVIGAGFGVFSGYIGGDEPTSIYTQSRSDKMVVYGISLGLLGTLTGGIMGGNRPGEYWKRVNLHIVPANTNSAATFTYSYRF